MSTNGKTTVQLYLLENKSIQATINGYPYSYEGGYNIVAGDKNSTEFEISGIPKQYEDFTFSLEMTNARKEAVSAPEIIDNKFILPIGMAVAGYGQIVIKAQKEVDGELVTAVFVPLKIKVVNTDANWQSGIINVIPIEIGTVEQLAPNEPPYVKNVGTKTAPVLDWGIPQGKTGEDGRGIETTDISYAISASGDSIPEIWESELPELEQGKYIWSRTIYTYTDDTSDTVYSVAYQGKDGESLVAVTGVKGNAEKQYRTGQVNLTPDNIGAVNKSGDTMTGSLTVPKILGAGENEGKGIIPVRYITRQELGTATSDVDGYIQAWIKKVCELYPNTENCIFIGSGNPAAAITLQACIYKTSERNSDGVPRYAYGVCLEYGHTNNIQQFSIVEHTYNPKKPFMTREGRWLDGDVKNATHSGVYYCSADSTGLPSGANRFGQLFVSHEHDTIAQIYISHENKQMWARGGRYSGGEVWTDWYRLANYDEVYSPNNPPPTAKDNKYGTVYGFTSNDIKETTRNTIGATTLGYNSVVQHGTGGTLQNCTAIGRAAEVRAFDGTATHGNCTAIGYGAGIYTADNTIQMGNSSISSFKCKVGVSTTSDERDKTDITVIDDGKALQFITQIDPIQYVDNDRNKYLLREKKIDEETGEETYDDDGANNQVYMRYGMCEYDREAHARGDKKGERKRIGVKAQQIQELLLDIFGSDNYANIVNDDHYDLRADGNAPPVENHLTVTYERLIPFLIGAIKEQQKQITELQTQIGELKNAVAQ